MPDNGQIAFDYFVSQGLSPNQAAGIVGNLKGESGQRLNPLAVNPGDGRDGSDSIGIGQWNGARAQALKDYAASKGTDWSDLNTQLEFLHSELKGPEKAAYEALTAARTPEDAARAFLGYERPKDWNKPGSHPERGQYAAAALAAYGGGGQAGQPAPVQVAQAQPARAIPQPRSMPIFSQSPTQQAQGLGGGSLFGQMAAEQPIQAAPIFYAQRKPVSLEGLRAALQAANNRGPIFRG